MVVEMGDFIGLGHWLLHSLLEWVHFYYYWLTISICTFLRLILIITSYFILQKVNDIFFQYSTSFTTAYNLFDINFINFCINLDNRRS